MASGSSFTAENPDTNAVARTSVTGGMLGSLGVGGLVSFSGASPGSAPVVSTVGGTARVEYQSRYELTTKADGKQQVYDRETKTYRPVENGTFKIDDGMLSARYPVSAIDNSLLNQLEASKYQVGSGLINPWLLRSESDGKPIQINVGGVVRDATYQDLLDLRSGLQREASEKYGVWTPLGPIGSS